MIFEEIHIKNLFSYREAVFDLDGASSDRNIALISGRNGYGKTSLINCIKLLFVGANEDMRASVLSGRSLTRKQYILGTHNDEWLGIMNRRARRAGEKDCEIRITWRDGSNDSLIDARRAWRIDSTGFEETLAISGTGSSVLQDDAAREYLEGLLPQDYLPFFFFDGEQIQCLAEANREKLLAQIERLLNISPIDTLREDLNRLANEWRKKAMVEGEKSCLTELEGDQNTLSAQLGALEEKRTDTRSDIDRLKREVQEEEHRLDSHRVASQDHDKKALTGKRDHLAKELEETQDRIADSLPSTVPLLANPRLVKSAVAELRKLVENDATQQASALQDVLSDLQTDLFDKPPHSSPRLTESQIRFYKHRLESLLRAHIPRPEDMSEGLLRMELSRARALLSVLDHFAQADRERRTQAQTLQRITRLKRDFAEVALSLDDVSHLPEEEHEEFFRRKAANDERKRRIGALEQEIKHSEESRTEINKQLREKDKAIRDQEKQVRLSAAARAKVERAEQMHGFFRAYKDTLKRHKREAIERAINTHFQALVTGHALIQHIHVAEDFGIHFEDSEGRARGQPVGGDETTHGHRPAVGAQGGLRQGGPPGYRYAAGPHRPRPSGKPAVALLPQGGPAGHRATHRLGTGRPKARTARPPRVPGISSE
uniref:DNA sulfur modification protein DndD n=1 Tax=Candidatus Kentrum sp. LFY TaxID=2126342 RepID=A0A450U9F5_9GAMM|nr:MAG: DNA sulfur modification protein DndD [Candidatus Kentron sp. LFY]